MYNNLRNYQRQKPFEANVAYEDEIIDSNFLPGTLFEHFIVIVPLSQKINRLIPLFRHNARWKNLFFFRFPIYSFTYKILDSSKNVLS